MSRTLFVWAVTAGAGSASWIIGSTSRGESPLLSSSRALAFARRSSEVDIRPPLRAGAEGCPPVARSTPVPTFTERRQEHTHTAPSSRSLAAPSVLCGLEALHRSTDPPHLLDLRSEQEFSSEGALERPSRTTAEESAARMVRSCTSPHLLALLVRQTVATR
jgi:hypothetical protein